MASKLVKGISKLVGSQKLHVIRDLKALCVEVEDARLANEQAYVRSDSVPSTATAQSFSCNALPPPYICNHQCGLLTSSAQRMASTPPPPYSP